MATIRIPILEGNLRPDDSGNCFPEPYTIKATNDHWLRQVWIFNNAGSAVISLHGGFELPLDYVGTAKVVIVWTAQTTSGNVVWNFDYRGVGGNDTESLDQATSQETVTVTDAAPGAVNRRLEVSISLTSANLAAGDSVEFFVSRDKSSGSDTMAGAATLWDLELEYANA